MKDKLNLINKETEGIYFIIVGILLTILLSLFTSAQTINSTNYSGFITQGSAAGNITGTSYDGHSTSFYQSAIGYLNDLLFTGIHGFSFNVSAPSGSPPTINLTRPKNATYIVRTNLPLNYTSLNALYVWYNIDGTGSNTTLSGNTTFTATNGLHTIYLWGNNTYGNSVMNKTFTADTTRFVVHYNNYSGATRGQSTDFNLSTYEELQNLSNIIWENTDYGKVKFNVALNLTNDSDVVDNDLDLDIYTDISNNSIEVNSTMLPNFNKSATLYLYNLSFTNPRILRDDSVCPSAICTEINYSGGTFVFNVTQFSNYSADETPEETTTTTTTSGGGGGGGTTTAAFTVDKTQISVTLNPGQVRTEEITITNTADTTIVVRIDNLIQDFVARGEDIVILNPGGSKVVPLYILARVGTIPDLYLGKLILSSGNIKKEILIAIEVESEGALLDVRAEIEESYTKVLPREHILAQIRLFNLGGEGRKDVDIEYLIRDYQGNEIVRETESLAIETQLTFLKEIDIPSSAKTGSYVLYVKATYEGKIASASDNFEIVSSKVTAREKIYIITIIVLSVIISLIFYLSIRRSLGWKGKKSKGAKRERRIELRSILKK